jgi:tetratricopeptide (TPR) repeat protein
MSLGRKLALSTIGTIAFFVLLDLALWAAGVRTLLAERDPFQGFSGAVHLFEEVPGRGILATPARATRQSFAHQEFAAEKPANGFRLFTLGGSSALGFPWGADEAFTRLVGDALKEAWPDRAVEAINAAGMSYGSHRMRILAREIASYHPDLVIVFEGHNEFVESRFYAGMIDRSASLDALHALLYRWRLYSELIRMKEWVVDSPRGDVKAATGSLLGLDVERDDRGGVTAEEKDLARARFESNLRAIVDTMTAAGSRVVLCTVPSNLRDWRPNQSLFDARTPAGARGRVARLIAGAGPDLDRGDAAAAVKALEEARGLAPEYAATQFDLGRAYEALGRLPEAREAYRLARDEDAQPTRALSVFNETIRRVAAARGAILVDVERLFEEKAADGIPGFDLIEDYVHPKPEAHRLIAWAIYGTIVESGLFEPKRAADRASFDHALDAARAARPPVTGAAAPARRAAMLFNTAVVLESGGRAAEAIEKYRATLDLAPDHYAARCNLGRLLDEQGDAAAAVDQIRKGLAVAPDHVNCLLELGRALSAMGDAGGSLSAYERAAALNPGSSPALRGIGIALAQQGRIAEAETKFRGAVALDPRDADAFACLGQALLSEGKLDDSVAQSRRSLALDPSNHRALIALASALVSKGELDEAERIYRDVLADDPNDAWARRGMEEVGVRRRDRGLAPGSTPS